MNRILLAIIILMSLSGVFAPAEAGQNISARMPLYQDATGWSLWSASSGVRFVDWYTDGLFRANGDRIPIELQAFEAMIDEPEQWIGFAVKVPDDITTAWKASSTITITYVSNGDTLSAVSLEWMIQKTTHRTEDDLYVGEAVRSGGFKGFEFVDPQKLIFTTSNGNPLLFARFPLREIPDLLLNCTVANVTTIKRGGVK